MDFNVANEAETESLAGRLAAILRGGDVVFLHGDLGAGKTTLARALIRALCDTPGMDVPSPTFTLVQTYDADAGTIWHFDLYRMTTPDDVWELGWEDAMDHGIVLVEWPERLGNRLAPPSHLAIGLAQDTARPEARRITLTPHGSWKDRDLI